MKNETIASILDYANELHHDKVMVEYKGNTHYHTRTYRRTVKYVKALASSMLRDGLSGSRIMIFCENSFNMIISDLAVMAYVGVSIPVDPEWVSDELCNMIEKLSPSAIIYSNITAPKIEAVRKKYKTLRYYSADNDIQNMVISGQNLLNENGSVDGFFPKNPDSVCKILCTIGASNHAKAVPVSANNLFANYESVSKHIAFIRANTL